MTRQSIVAFALGVVALFAAQDARAQAYPARTIELIHGFGPGGQADIVGRAIAAPLSEALGKQVQVIGKPGAGGNIASDFVAKASPDGYTLVLFVGGHAVSAALYKKLPFHPIDDFAFVSNLTVNPFAIAVRKESDIKDLRDLIAKAKQSPGKFTFSSAGIGSTQHLVGELLAQRADIKLTHIPYKGGAQPLTDLLGGNIDLLVDTIPTMRGPIEAGTIRALGVTTPEPWPAIPQVPTIMSVIPNFTVMSWIGIAAPKNTPRDIVDRLNGEIRKVLQRPDIQERLAQLGGRVQGTTPEGMKTFVAGEIARWNETIDKAGVERQ